MSVSTARSALTWSSCTNFAQCATSALPDSGSAEVARWAKFVQLDQVSADLAVETDKPDHTYHLRSLATQVAAGIHVEPATQMIRELLAEETEIDGDQLQALWRITLGALA